MRGRYSEGSDRGERLRDMDNNEEDGDYMQPSHSNRRMPEEQLPRMDENAGARSSHIFDQSRGPDNYNDNLGRREHFNRRLSLRDSADDYAGKTHGSPTLCDKKRNGICDELHGELMSRERVV